MILPRHQACIGADLASGFEAMGIVDPVDDGFGGDASDTVDGLDTFYLSVGLGEEAAQ